MILHQLGRIKLRVVEENHIRRCEAHQAFGAQDAAQALPNLLQDLIAAACVRIPGRCAHKGRARHGLGGSKHIHSPVRGNLEVHTSLGDHALRSRLDHAAYTTCFCQPGAEVSIDLSVAQHRFPRHEVLQHGPHLASVGADHGGLFPHQVCPAFEQRRSGGMRALADLLHLLQVDVAGASGAPLVVDLEEPGPHLGMFHDEPGQRCEELVLVVDVHGPGAHWELSKLRQLLAVGLGRHQRHVAGAGANQWQPQRGAEFGFVVCHCLRD
mmetsp:Transcript_130463/g.309512  ORF Transcript_130463/g.309512 Transcript_130463/m.309512 type:complete len:268 (+) Transcript_130463:853-1656(+)